MYISFFILYIFHITYNMNPSIHGKFGPTTPNMISQMHHNMHNNFQQSFAPNREMIETTDYVNKRQVIHNNLNDKLLTERVVEYRILINSIDRDVKMFPSPFDMKVSFGNNNVYPNITRKFKNIKYVTLNSIMTPRTIAIDTSKTIPETPLPVVPPPPPPVPPLPAPIDYRNLYPTSSIYAQPPLVPALPTNDVMNNLENRPFLIVRAKELDSDNVLGTSPLYDSDTFILIADQKIGDMYRWKPQRTTTVYPNSLLTNLNQLTLSLLDESGKKLNIVDQVGNNIIGKNINIYVPYDFNGYVAKYSDENKYVDYTNRMTQVIYDFTFGVIENELNTQINF